MELEIFEALVSINVDKEKAKAVANSIDAAIDKRYGVHARHLVTKGDLEEVKSELIKWIVGALIASTSLMTAIVGALLK